MTRNTFIIAEAGANHDRDFEQAIRLIDIASESGADAVKFQTYSSETLYTKNTPDFAGYKNINQLIKDIELPREWQKDLKQYCDENGIEFMSTPFDEEAVEELVNLGIKRLKISGFESTDPRFVDVVCSAKLPVIMSIGIGFNWDFWETYLNIFKKHKNHVTLLHCNNAYPTPAENTYLDTIKTLKHEGVDCVGFSDHTMSTLTPALAVSFGAEVIEKHFTISRSLSGPDHNFALEPEELKEMVYNIRFAEKCFGLKGSISDSEKNFENAMRSVVSTKKIKKGEKLSKDNISTKRPFLKDSISAIEYSKCLGIIAKEDIQEECIIKKSQIEQIK